VTDERRLLRLADADNVLIVAAPIAAGETVAGPDGPIVVRQDVEVGHKVAAWPIFAGEKVVRFSMPIGSATQDVATGEWVHTHNLSSDYIRTFDHRGGEDDV
jgi:hypothetical protein